MSPFVFVGQAALANLANAPKLAAVANGEPFSFIATNHEGSRGNGYILSPAFPQKISTDSVSAKLLVFEPVFD